MTNLLDIRHVSCDLSDSFALRDVSLAVAPGEIVGFVGANGAGKTTMIRVTLGLQHIGAGEVKLFGEPFGADASDRVQRAVRSRIGVVLDACPFPSELRVSQVVTCLRPAFSQWDDSLFGGLIARFGINSNTKMKELSRGMGMKLQIAVALSHGADLLLLDEATAGLDPLARDEILDMLQEFVGDGERGVLLSSHITSDLERVADRVVGIDAGRIIFDAPREPLPIPRVLRIARLARWRKSSNACRVRVWSSASSAVMCSCRIDSNSRRRFPRLPAIAQMWATICTSC